jgi:U3 small nucleolar RNA-associated protein 10
MLTHVKRRAHALVVFTAAAFEGSSLSTLDADIGGLDKLVAALLEISSSRNTLDTTGEHSDLDHIAQAARVALTECIRSMHAAHFVISMANILKEGRADEHVSRGVLAETLNVFVDKLPSVSQPVREEVSPTIVTIVIEIKRFLPLDDESLVNAALCALKVIGSSIVSGEESFLVDCLPLVLAASRSEQRVAAALAALPPLWYVQFKDSLPVV